MNSSDLSEHYLTTAGVVRLSRGEFGSDCVRDDARNGKLPSVLVNGIRLYPREAAERWLRKRRRERKRRQLKAERDAAARDAARDARRIA